mmetsp:Transcript_82979/g.225321  ORF Transcript_82979/g.225321 Transcript_82979/m.225321 type:complete len:493 (-) Transcript_82979:55-1533(-)
MLYRVLTSRAASRRFELMSCCRTWALHCRRITSQSDVHIASAIGSQSEGLGSLNCQQVVFLLDEVSRAGLRDPDLWGRYASRALTEVSTCSVDELCSIVRALCRADFSKRSLLNAVCRRLRVEAHKLSPRSLAQVVSDLRKLNHLDGPLLSLLVGSRILVMSHFRTFDLPLVLCAFAQVSFRDEVQIHRLGQELCSRSGELTPSVITATFYSLALLDCGKDGIAAHLLCNSIPRVIGDASSRELVNLAFAIVILDLHAAEILSYILEQLARQSAMIGSREVHALHIIKCCVTSPEAFRPEMRASFLADPTSVSRCTDALQHIAGVIQDVPVNYAVSGSKLQKRLGRFLDRLSLPHRAEAMIGPYVLDYMLPLKIAIEVDGFKHFYSFSRRLTAKSKLKLRVLKALGWHVVSLPHFEWLPKTQDERLAYLACQIEDVSGKPLAEIRRGGGCSSSSGACSSRIGELVSRTRRLRPLPFSSGLPARGTFASGVRR